MPWDSDLASIDLKALLHKFFKFYSDKNITNYILSPYMGKQYTKKDFDKDSKEDLPSYVEFCKKNPNKKFNITKGICLQDPIQLNKNLTESLPTHKFKPLCKEMVNILSV